MEESQHVRFTPTTSLLGRRWWQVHPAECTPLGFLPSTLRMRTPTVAASRAADAIAHAIVVGASSLGALLARAAIPGSPATPPGPPAASAGFLGAVRSSPLLLQLAAMLPALLPAACVHGWRAFTRRRRLRLQQPRRIAILDDLLAEAAAASAQPLEGAARAALRECLEEALQRGGAHPLGPYALRPSAPPATRAAALLACRVEAMRRTVSRPAVPPAPTEPPPNNEPSELVASCTACGTRPFSLGDSAAGSAAGSASVLSSAGSSLSHLPPPCADDAAGAGAVVCKICWDRPCDALLAPCGHVAACLECLSHMIKAGVEGGNRATPLSLRCPICVAPVHDVVRAFT